MMTRRRMMGMMAGTGALAMVGAAPCVAWARGATPEADASPYAPSIDPADFGGAIDNPRFPMIPSTTFSYAGESEDGPQTNDVTVTPDTKVILGVTCVVVQDIVRTDGEITEDTIDWYAQDRAGNVWYFGEASSDLEGGKVVSTEGSWEAGVDGALPGIVMPADPKVGDRYRQEYQPGVAEDAAEVVRFEDGVETPYGTYDGVLVTREANPLEPGAAEEKFYAQGVGLLRAVAVIGPAERIDLVAITVDGTATPSA